MGDTEHWATWLAERFTGFYVRQEDEPVDVARVHRELAEEIVEHIAVDCRRAVERVTVLERALLGAVEALDDAIKHNVNATEHDPAGWTQQDYDAWEWARARGEEALNG